jgi:hypothetical protein
MGCLTPVKREAKEEHEETENGAGVKSLLL